MKKLFTVLICAMMILGIGGCSKEDGNKNVDENFIQAASSGLDERWNKQAKENGDLNAGITDYAELKSLIPYMEIEFNAIKDFENKEFNDSKLQQLAKNYIASMKESIEIVSKITSNYDTKILQYNDLMDMRDKVIAKLYNDFHLKVSDNNAVYLSNIVNSGNSLNEQDEKKFWADDTFLVGTDIDAGEYVIIAKSSSCEVQLRSTEYTGSDTEIYESNTALGFTIDNIYLTIEDGQYLYLSGCRAYKTSDYPTLKTDGYGTYKVGKDIEAGLYEIGDGATTGSFAIFGNSEPSFTNKNIIYKYENIENNVKKAKVEDGQYLEVYGTTLKKIE